MTTYTIGMTIKSFDFPNDDTCFYIGKITEIDGDFLYCDVISQTYLGKKLPRLTPSESYTGKASRRYPQKTFRTVKQGCMMMDESFQRVVILG